MQKHKILNWTGRVCGLLIIGFFLLFFVGEGIPDIANGKGRELLIFLPFTFPTSWLHIRMATSCKRRLAYDRWGNIDGGLLLLP